MAANDTAWEEFPPYSELVRGIVEFVEKTYRETFVQPRKPADFELTWKYYNFNYSDIFLLVVLSCIWTVIRHLATKNIFNPIARYYALTPANQNKMPESAWKFLYYLCAWSYTFYVVILSRNYIFFQKPSTIWNGWDLEKRPPLDIYIMYMGQCSFYIHSLYATLFQDTWRKDSLVMMIHHVLTIALISISYSLRYHNIGTLVLLTHDVCDILLEFTKLNVYFKVQDNQLVKKHEIFANISFFLFTVAWYVSRLYVYPFRVLYTATFIVQAQKLILPCALLMNSLLWILQILNIYWFLFILQFLFRVATGQVSEVDDTREYDVEEKFKQLAHRNSTLENEYQNGIIKSNGNQEEGEITNGNLDGSLINHEKKIR